MTLEQLAVLFSVAQFNLPEGAHKALCLELADEGLLTLADDGSVEHKLTDRGRAFVDHVIGLPLPESVTTWSIPGSAPAPRAARARRKASRPAIAPPRPFVATPPVAELTPEEKRTQAARLVQAGWGRNEVAEKFGMTAAEVDEASGFR